MDKMTKIMAMIIRIGSRLHRLKMLKVAFLAVSLSVLLCALAYAEKLTVAVFDFEARDEATAGLAGKMTDLVFAELSLMDEFRFVERVNGPWPVPPGNVVGAQILILGRMFALNGDLVVIVKIIGTETSRVEAAVVRTPFIHDLQPTARELAQKIRTIILEKAGEFVTSMKP